MLILRLYTIGPLLVIIKLNNNFLYASTIRGPKDFSAKKAKARAIQHALVMRAKDMNLARIYILSDSKDVVMALNGSSDWTINAIVLDMLSLSLKFKSLIFVFIPKRLRAYLDA